jgi:RNA polymerase sigma-70 factor (ECF subfamily)
LLAEDFVQDAFCILWENRNKINPDQPVMAYLYKLVKSRCVDYLRKNHSRDNYTREIEWKLRELELLQASDESHVLENITANEVQGIIQRTLETLSAQTLEISN